MERTICRWKMAKTTRSGISAISDPASTRFHWTPKFDWNEAMPTVSTLRLSELVTISGHKKLFQPKTKAITVAVTITGLASGTSTWTRIRASEQPSILA